MYRLTMSDKTIHDQSAVSTRPHQISPISPETVADMAKYLDTLQEYCLSGVWVKISPNMRKSLFSELKHTFAWVKYHAPLLQINIDMKNMAQTMNLMTSFTHTGNRILTEKNRKFSQND